MKISVFSRAFFVLWSLVCACLYGQTTYSIDPGTDPAPIVAAASAGDTILFKSGVHRNISIEAKQGVTFAGEVGTILNGASLITSWIYQAPFWVSTSPITKLPQNSYPTQNNCWVPTCAYPQDMYRDDIVMRRALDVNSIYDENTWYFDYDSGQAYVKFNPLARKVEVSGYTNCLRTTTSVGQRITDVTVRNLIVEKYASHALGGAIALTDSSLIEDVEARLCHGVGIVITADNSHSTLRRCYCHHNGQNGVIFGGKIICEDSEFSFNAWAGFSGNWTRGGIRSGHISNSIIRRNYTHDNIGPGIWVDIQSFDVIIEHNISERNSWEGVLFEVSCSGHIRQNYFRHNGRAGRGQIWGAQICVQNSKNVEVLNNYCETGGTRQAAANGIILINQETRGIGTCGYNNVADCNIQNNTIILPDGGENGLSWGTLGWNTYGDFLAEEPQWNNQTYYFGNHYGSRWRWLGPGDGSGGISWDAGITFQQFRQSYGHDLNSTRTFIERPTFDDFRGFLLPIANAQTGQSYDAIKLAAKRHTNRDFDNDGLEDGWEWENGLDTSTNDAAKDLDYDGLTNLEEQARGTDAASPDSDRDDLLDGIEVNQGLNPLVYLSRSQDTDSDGVPDYDEVRAGMNRLVSDELRPKLAPGRVSFWFRKGVGETTNPEGKLTAWADQSISARHGISGGLTATTADGISQPLWRNVGAAMGLNSTVPTFSDGCALVFIASFPTNSESSRGSILALDAWPSHGFRIAMDNGVPIPHSTGSQIPFYLVPRLPLIANRAYVFTLSMNSITNRVDWYINGSLAASGNGRLTANSLASSFILGGTSGAASTDCAFGDVLFYGSPITIAERETAESMLMGKYLGLGPLAGDGDANNSPDWQDVENATLAAIATLNAPRDPTKINVSILEPKFIEAGYGPVSGFTDEDEDNVNDAWETSNGISTLINDGDADLDFDGMDNRMESLLGTNPRVADSAFILGPSQSILGSVEISFVVNRKNLGPNILITEMSTDLTTSGWEATDVDIDRIEPLDQDRARVVVRWREGLEFVARGFFRLKLQF